MGGAGKWEVQVGSRKCGSQTVGWHLARAVSVTRMHMSARGPACPCMPPAGARGGRHSKANQHEPWRCASALPARQALRTQPAGCPCPCTPVHTPPCPLTAACGPRSPTPACLRPRSASRRSPSERVPPACARTRPTPWTTRCSAHRLNRKQQSRRASATQRKPRMRLWVTAPYAADV